MNIIISDFNRQVDMKALRQREKRCESIDREKDVKILRERKM